MNLIHNYYSDWKIWSETIFSLKIFLKLVNKHARLSWFLHFPKTTNNSSAALQCFYPFIGSRNIHLTRHSIITGINWYTDWQSITYHVMPRSGLSMSILKDERWNASSRTQCHYPGWRTRLWSPGHIVHQWC